MQCKSDGTMDDVVTENVGRPSPLVLENEDLKSTDSAENFQTFMYELFEKNGVINDMRAYLRGHIVGLLRSSRTGDPPPCQKNFTQRLELPYQALNMLIAEYLLNFEFSYTLSVFISEIPLANMVLSYAKSLMQGTHTTGLRFKDDDVWSILNFLGVKCDSAHASKIVDMYGKEKLPLLLCMIKCVPLYGDVISLENTSSQDSLSSSVKSCDSRSHPTSHRCKHVKYCRTCRGNMTRIKDKYQNKKRTLAKKAKGSSFPQNMDALMKNIDIIERSLIDEMFQQLKSVYETEIKMVKNEEEQRAKKSLTAYLIQLQKKKAEMEETFRAREVELERNVARKKRFLWGLAKLLREQQQHMSQAMRDLQDETSRLAAKEDSLKSQLVEAEQILRQRGEDMRQMISNELVILEQHLDSMKKERDTINKERSELEHLKHLYDSTAKTTNLETTKEDLRSHYDLLKNEFNILKSYLETAKLEPKCMMERSTLTEDGSTGIDGVLNNGQDLERSRSEDRVKAKRVVNDLKKMKNVNFSQSNLTEIYERSRCSTSSSAGDDTRNLLERLREENERLRTFARQQREHIDELSSQQARLSAELSAARASVPPPTPAPRANTAPTTPQNIIQGQTPADTSRGFGWQKGAGEEMSFFANAHPRIVVPGDTLPFIGVVSARHTDNRRYLINQWRSLRRRMSPVDAGKVRVHDVSPTRDRDVAKERASSAGPSIRTPQDNPLSNIDLEVTSDRSYPPTHDYEQTSRSPEKLPKDRDKSAKAILRDSKERIKSKDHKARRHVERAPSPNTVLRDAKLRLRKLEIEAQAVEKSYLDFRRKQDALRGERCDDHIEGRKDIDSNQDRPPYKLNEDPIESTSHYVPPTTAYEQIIEDIDEYRAKYDISLTHFGNKTATPSKLKPIPPAYAYDVPKTKRNQNYVDTPLQEFRKYYQSDKRATYKEKESFDDRPGTSVTKTAEYDNVTKAPVVPRHTTDTRIPTPIVKNRKLNSDSRDKNLSSSDKSEQKSPKHRDPSPSQTPNIEGKTRIRSPKTKNSPKSPKMEKQINKATELKILKENISKIYNLSQNTMANNNEGFDEAVSSAKWKLTDIKQGIITETITEVSPDETASDVSKELAENKNLLRVDLQAVSNELKLTDSKPQGLLVVESAIVKVGDSDGDTDLDEENNVMPTQMTILVSPKTKTRLSEDIKSPKLIAKESIEPFYDAEQNDNKSTNEMNSKDALVAFLSDDNGDPDYPDDFSPEVEPLENLNSQRDDTDDRSPISMAKISEDENFWDS